MAVSNHERVGKALDLMNRGLLPFVAREMKAIHKDAWEEVAQQSLRADKVPAQKGRKTINWDSQAILAVMWEQWNSVFRNTLGATHRSMVSELRDVRNSWAHQTAFTTDDAYRALDTIHRLLAAVSAEEAQEVERSKHEILRLRFEDQAKKETKKAAAAPLDGQPVAGLKSWREVVTPHPDVASGRYQQAEFAANLGQVHRGEGVDEYRDPVEFFRRTYLTEGLRRLLVNALMRLTNTGGDPVVDLQTNFGGGKTHSMLALYHLFGGAKVADLPGVEGVLKEAGVTTVPKVRRAVLVGQDISPGKTHKKTGGVEVHTLWGELAWQLLGKEGYALIAESDKTGTNPGSELREVFKKAAPCLILIDEWVAYVRQLYGVFGLPAGSFDANLTFAQALTEGAMAVPGVLIVASLPASDIEIGGAAGREALNRLKNTFGRTEAPWRPASGEEGFEIVRRRLFQPIGEPGLFAVRDAVVNAFGDMYRTQAAEFPSTCKEADYIRRLQLAYPIHPELFERLYNDWSSMEKFQRTRGVLRLMAAVVHALWEREDRSLLILPASVPVDEPGVQFELTRHLEDTWTPVLEGDVDGSNSLPLRLDRENPNLGRYSACRRVARTLYMGSAPTFRSPNKGLEDKQIRLGCAQPGESVATFGDALRRLTDQATHLYVDGKRYWYSPQPSVTRLAQDRAGQQDADQVVEEIKRRLRDDVKDKAKRGDFERVHVAPGSSGDVPDDPEARLVILGPETPHAAKQPETPARQAAAEMLQRKGSGNRNYANAVVFLAADRTRLGELEGAVRQYLSWKSIADESDGDQPALELDAFQKKQVKTKLEQAEDTVRQRVPEAYCWLLVAGQSDTKAAIEWQEMRLQGPDGLAVRASKKLKADELLITNLGPTRLRMEIDRIPLWRGEAERQNSVALKQLAEDFARYLYLPRLRDAGVLRDAIQAGLRSLTWQIDSFALADGYDPAKNRYHGLKAGEVVAVAMDGAGLLVRPEVADEQLRQDRAKNEEREGGSRPVVTTGPGGHGHDTGSGTKIVGGGSAGGATPTPPKYTRFHGTIRLDATRLGRDAGKVAEEIVKHLAGLVDAEVEVTLEIQATFPNGVPEGVLRVVTENSRTLKFTTAGFEEE